MQALSETNIEFFLFEKSLKIQWMLVFKEFLSNVTD